MIGKEASRSEGGLYFEIGGASRKYCHGLAAMVVEIARDPISD
jgi:hypothetical protein